MKRLFLLVVIGLLLVGCGLADTAQDNLSNAASLVVYKEGVAAVFPDQEPLTVEKANLQCAGIFVQRKTSVDVTFRVTIDDSALGVSGPIFGAGSIVLGESDMRDFEGQAFTCEGSGQLRAYKTNPEGPAVLVDWLLEQKFDSFKIDIDGATTTLTNVTMTGLARAGGGETAVLTNNENIAELKSFQCQGKMIPNSSQAAVTFTAETSDGQTFAGGGILETSELINMGADPNDFQCNMTEKGFVSQKYTADLVLGFKGTDEELQAAQGNTVPMVNLFFPSLNIRRGGQEQQIMFETFMTGTTSNFNIGMPPT
ncbi:MAG: hypothetical protein DWQ04_10700 [Chloroflexi bacterium]|nr:MAG: hypothetical protein DWQ04_10700 [Chloroflexota bacterium]